MTIRIIPRLDIKGPNLVKGINLEGLRILGEPESFAREYYQQGADELLYLDAVASLYGRNSLTEFVKKTASAMFIPLTVGGGIRSLEDIRSVLLAGADKIALNTAALEDPQLIKSASETFGSSTVVLSLVAKQHDDGRYTAFTNNGRDDSGRDVFDWLEQAVELGAGEVLVTAMERDGTAKGYDLELIKKVNQRISNPVIACGGAGSVQDVLDVIKLTGVKAVSLASALHYPLANKRMETGNILQSGGEFKVIQDSLTRAQLKGMDLAELRTSLMAQDINVRPIDDSEPVQTDVLTDIREQVYA